MPEQIVLATSKVERVGDRSEAIFSFENTKTGFKVKHEKLDIPTYTDGINLFIQHLTESEGSAIDSIDLVDGIGFKTVLSKGFYGVHLLDETVLSGMEEYLDIAPVHNSCYLEAIREFRSLLPETALVGVFETEFHTTIPLERKLYGIPYEWYEKYGIQRFGYHGASHRYISECIGERYGASKIISCHLGGSCSICAIEDGRSVDTSFGFSLQTGVLHANRVGDLDAYIIPFLLNRGFTIEEILSGLDNRGGLLGISGVSNDMRFLMEQIDTNDRVALAVAMFRNDVVRYAGAFYAQLGGLDHLVFTGGIGENDSALRADVCGRLAVLGVELDEDANRNLKTDSVISKKDSKVMVHIIATDEEAIVVRKTYQLLTER